MASAPQAQGLPVLYNDLVPLSSRDHGDWKMRQMESLDFIKSVHAVPVTVDEFIAAQRSLPIVFTAGSDPVPLGLLGLNEGVNVFLGEDGRFGEGAYVPAYVRRYPFMLARLNPNAEELSLCFDPTSNLVGPFEDGLPLFENGEPSEHTRQALNFCEQFETAARRTGQFMADLAATGLIEDGEVTMTNPALPQPFVYRGFQMINEEKTRELRGDQLRKMNQNGMLPLLHAHLFSLSLMSELFGRQMRQGKTPLPQPQPEPWSAAYSQA